MVKIWAESGCVLCEVCAKAVETISMIETEYVLCEVQARLKKDVNIEQIIQHSTTRWQH